MEKALTIQIPRYGDNILQCLHRLQQCGYCCDTTLKARDGDLQIHGLILTANSQCHAQVQAKEDLRCDKIAVTDIDCRKYHLQVVESVVILLYTGEVVIEEQYITELYRLCQDLQLHSAYSTLKEHYSSVFSLIESDDEAISENSGQPCIPFESRIEGTCLEPDKDPCINNEPRTEFFCDGQHHVNTVNERKHMFIKINDNKPLDENVELEIPIGSVEKDDSDNNSLPETEINDNQVIGESNTPNRCKNQVKNEDTEWNETKHRNKIKSARNRKSRRTFPPNKCTSKKHSDNTANSNESLTGRYKQSKHCKKGNSVSDKKPTEENSLNSSISDEVQTIEISERKYTTKSRNKRKKKIETDSPCKRVKRNRTVKTNTANEGHDKEGSASDTETTPKEKKKYSYKCVQCDIIFRTYSERSVHMREIHKPFSCDMCGWVGVHPYQYASHMYGQHKVVINPERYPLVECPEEGCTYKSLSCSMNDHRRSHKFKVDKLVCHVCGMEFSSSTGLLVHSSYHKEADMKYKCRQCGKVFGWRHELNKHMTAEHNNYKLCHICPFKAKSKTSLIIHLHNVHGEPIPAKMKTYECDCCDFYCFYPSYLKIHKQENHSDVMNYKCSDCPKEFKTKKSLRSHREHTHSTNFYFCDKCDYKTRTLSTLQTHEMSTHSELRPFSCHLCSYSCKLRGNLNSHLKNIHKMELVSTAQLREKMIKTGKGFNEYLDARRNFTDSERRADLTLRTRPVIDGPDSSDDRAVDNFREQYPDFMSALEPSYLQLR